LIASPNTTLEGLLKPEGEHDEPGIANQAMGQEKLQRNI